MSTIQLTELETRTAGMLTAMFTENTGTHMLDSGGAYGRHWERNQGRSLTDFLAAPSATWSRDWGITVDAWHYLNDRLTYSKTAEVLTRLMHVWELKDYDNRNLYNLGDQEEVLEALGAERVNGFNSYNWENCLSQTLQGYTFDLMGSVFVLLQVHGGCDVRGGYTMPVIFEANEYFFYGMDEAILSCLNCEVSGSSRIEWGNEWQRYGDVEPDLFGKTERWFMPPEGYDPLNGCPECGGDLEAEGVEY